MQRTIKNPHSSQGENFFTLHPFSALSVNSGTWLHSMSTWRQCDPLGDCLLA